MATGEVTRVADIAAADGLPARGVFAQVTESGQFCLFDAPSVTSSQRGGGCNPADEPLGGNAISASLAYEGGPAIEGVRRCEAHRSGRGRRGEHQRAHERRVSRDMKLKKAKVGADEFVAFGYRFRKADLRKGIGPTAIVAFDAGGVELGRQPTGIGG